MMNVLRISLDKRQKITINTFIEVIRRFLMIGADVVTSEQKKLMRRVWFASKRIERRDEEKRRWEHWEQLMRRVCDKFDDPDVVNDVMRYYSN